MFRNKQLTTMLNRLGHSEAYEFGLELEMAMTKAFDVQQIFIMTIVKFN